MNKYIALGKIGTMIPLKTIEGRSDGLQVTQINIPVNVMKPGQDRSESKTIWCELAAFGKPSDRVNMAQVWADKYSKGDWVLFEGNPTPRTYMKKNKETGEMEPAFALTLDNARLQKLPNQAEAQPAYAGAESGQQTYTEDDLPF